MGRYVDLDERVTAQFYDEECEEWTMQTCTIADVLDSVCDEYTVLPSAPPEQRWIPLDSGKFPEESGTYTITAYDGATMRVTYAKYQKRLKRWELTGARAYWRVLAWMPLPEPYKGET